MFYSIKELVEQADDFQGNVAELMIATEYQLTGSERPGSPPHGTQSRVESLYRARPQ